MNDCTFRNLIPNPTVFEHDLEQHAAQKYCELDADIIRALHDPWQCPVKFLPWLAYSLSVDVWNDRWPEAPKRAVCANSLEMHRHKGTHGGVVDALAALGIRAEIVYWHEMQPEGEPGTMQVTLWVHDNILPDAPVIIGEELTRDVLEQLNRSKRASIHYTFRLAVETDNNGVGIGLSAQMTVRQHIDAPHTAMDTSTQSTAISIGLSAQMTTRQHIDAPHTAMDTNTAPLSLVIACSAHMTTRLRIDASV